MDKAQLKKLIKHVGYKPAVEQILEYIDLNATDFTKRKRLLDETVDILDFQDKLFIANKNVVDFPTRPLPYIKIIHLLLTDNRFNEAFKYLGEGLVNHPTNKNLLHRSVMMNVHFQNWDRANQSLKVLETHWMQEDIVQLRLLFNVRSKRLLLPLHNDDNYTNNISKRQQYRLQTMFHGYTSMLNLCKKGIEEDADTLWWKIQQLKLYIITRENENRINAILNELSLEPDKIKTYKKQLFQIADFADQYKPTILSLIDEKSTEHERTVLSSNHSYRIDQTKQVDIVYTWADMNEDSLKTHFTNTTGIDPLTSTNEQQNISRHISNGEILLSLLSVEKYFTDVRHIFIVTPNQDFPLHIFTEPFQKKIRFINQDDILPPFLVGKVFNSTIIETFIHLIPDLSETFFYFCDDYFLGNIILPTDIFHDDGVPKINMLHRDLTKNNNISVVSSAHAGKAIPVMYVENARQLFLSTYGAEPNLTFPHQAMIMNKGAFKICLELYHEEWKNNFYREHVRGKQTVHTLTLISWISILHGYQKLNEDYNEVLDTVAFHFGFTEENLDYIQTIKPKYYCINNLENEYSKQNFKLLFQTFN